MAVATITLTPTESWDDGKRIHVIGTLAISAAADTYGVGGLAVPTPAVPGVVSSSKPYDFIANGLAGYIFTYDFTNAKLMVRVLKNAAATNDPLSELTAIAIPAGLSGDTIRFHAICHKLVE